METAKITSKEVGRLKIPAGVVLAGVIREGIFTLPDKHFKIKAGDSVLLFVEKGHVKDAESLLTVGFSFF